MSNRKWRETKQYRSRASSGHQISCCLVSLQLCILFLSKAMSFYHTASARSPSSQFVDQAAQLSLGTSAEPVSFADLPPPITKVPRRRHPSVLGQQRERGIRSLKKARIFTRGRNRSDGFVSESGATDHRSADLRCGDGIWSLPPEEGRTRTRFSRGAVAFNI